MNEGIKNKVANFKGIKTITDLYKKQTPKRKKIFWGCVIGVSLVVIASMTLLYNEKSSYKEIFPNMAGNEASAVASALTQMQIECKQTSDGKIMVPSQDYDRAIMSLVAEGFPKTTLAYDIFDKNVGIASTDSERQQYLIFQLNDRIAETIKKIKGIKNATVTLNIPKKEGYLINDSANTGSASVMIEMEYGENLSAKQVAAIKKLVSASVPDLPIQNVVVADAATGIAMSDGEEGADGGLNLQQLGFETQVEQRMADKVMNLLTLAYGRDNIRVSATVNLDYDKMITEQQQYIPEQDGGNVTGSKQEQYTMNGEKFASGVAGEEQNTDLPVYVDEDGDGKPEYIDYSKNVDYLVSYIKTRIQKDSAIIKDASIAVALKVSDLSEQSKEAIIDSISKATGIAKDKISVNNFNIPVAETPQQNTGIFGDIPMGLVIVIGISSLALILLIVLIIMRVLKKKKAAKVAEAQEQLGEQQKEAMEQLNIEAKKLREAAQAEKRQEDIIIEEVQDFADENPQIAAALIRNWLRGED